MASEEVRQSQVSDITPLVDDNLWVASPPAEPVSRRAPSARLGGALASLRFGAGELARRYSGALALVVLLGLVARGQAVFTPMFAIDSYLDASMAGPENSFDFLLSQGRYGLAALWWLRDAVGFYGMPAASGGLLLSIILLSAAGFAFCVAVARRPTPVEVVLFTALFSLHPFLTEFFHFAEATLNIVVAIALGAAGMAVATARRPRGWPIISTLLIWGALSIYQTVVAHLGAVWLLALIYSLVTAAIADRPSSSVVRPLAETLGVMFASVALYALGLVAVHQFTGIAIDQRGDLSQLLDLHTKIEAVKMALRTTYWPSAGLISPFASVLLLLLLGFAAVVTVRPLIQRRRLVSLALALACILGALVWSCSASVLGGIVWLVPRVISPVSLAIAGLVLLAWRFAGAYSRLAIAMATGLLCVSYIGASNQILFDQRRVNLWDAQQANRIVMRLEQLTKFEQMQALAFVGGRWWRTSSLPTAGGDMNISAFSASWSKLGAIEMTTGYRFRTANADEMKAAEAYCSQAALWPAPNAVTIIKDLGVVCLPPS